MKLYSISFKVEIGFEDIFEAIIENGFLDILGYNVEYPAKENSAIINIYNETKEKLENNFNIIKDKLDINYNYEIKELDSEKYLTSYMDYLKPF